MTEGVDIAGIAPDVDKGAERDAREAKPCALRGTNLKSDGTREHAWCRLPDGHAGVCNGVFSDEPAAPTFTPRRSK